MGNFALSAVKSVEATEGLDAASVQLISDLSAGVDADVDAILAKHSEEAQQGEEAVDSSLRKKVSGSIRELQAGLLEREMEVAMFAWCAWDVRSVVWL